MASEEPSENARESSSQYRFVEVIDPTDKQTTRIRVPLQLIENAESFPVRYSVVQGEPKHILTVFIDANFKIRGTEVSQNILFTEIFLGEVLCSCTDEEQAPTLDRIYQVILFQRSKIIEEYLNENWTPDFDLSEMPKRMKKLNKKKGSATELFIKYEDEWVAGLKNDDSSIFAIASVNLTVGQVSAFLRQSFVKMMGPPS